MTLADLEQARASHDTCPSPKPHQLAALQYLDSAFSVFDATYLAYRHQKATALRERILAALNA